MSHYYSAGCTNETAFICDCCQIDDGRPTLYWPEKDFNLCVNCLQNLFIEHNNIKSGELIIVSRMVISEGLRNEIFERDGNKCLQCGATSPLVLDHIIPFSVGGTTSPENLRTLCRK